MRRSEWGWRGRGVRACGVVGSRRWQDAGGREEKGRGRMGRRERQAVAGGERLYEAALAVVGDHRRAVDAVREALEPIHDAAAERTLEALEVIPVARLKEVAEGRPRLGEVERSGLRSVRQVLDAGSYRLRQIPGVGQRTADQVVAAARRVSDAVREAVAVPIDADRPEPRSTALVMALHVLVGAGPDARRALDVAVVLAERLGPLLAEARPAAGRLWMLRMLPAGRAGRDRVLVAVAEVRGLTEDAERGAVPELLAQASVDLLRGPPTEVAAWVDFELRSAEYHDVLAEISGRGHGRGPAAERTRRPRPRSRSRLSDPYAVGGPAVVAARRIAEEERTRPGTVRGPS